MKTALRGTSKSQGSEGYLDPLMTILSMFFDVGLNRNTLSHLAFLIFRYFDHQKSVGAGKRL